MPLYIPASEHLLKLVHFIINVLKQTLCIHRLFR